MSSTITAVRCGTERSGEPITRSNTFELTRDPEPFGEGMSRLWGVCVTSARHGLDEEAPLAVVRTASIRQVA